MIMDRRTRIGIYQQQSQADDQGGRLVTWPFWKAAWANVKPLSPRERAGEDRLAASSRFRIAIYHFDNFPNPARVLLDGITLNVLAASDPDGRRERLHLICEEITA